MINDIKSQISIITLISKYMKLKKRGRLYWGLCPFHNEKTSSFAVNEDKKIFHCFGCGLSGDCFKFVELIENKSFSEVLNELANNLGIKLKKQPANPINYELILNKCLDFYITQLNNDYYNYLINRNIDPTMISKFQLGYANENTVVNYLYGLFPHNILQEAGIITQNGLDRFRNRIIIPIKNRQNNVIGFSGRTMNDDIKPKYLNSAESDIFKKSLHLFGEQFLNEITKDHIILVEGYMDVIKMHQYGFTNTLGMMGTSLNRGHFLSLFQKKPKIIIMFDGDDAGIRALENNLHILLQSVTPNHHIYVVLLDHKDPDSLLDEVKDSSIMDKYINNALPLDKWINNYILSKPAFSSNYALFLEKIHDLCTYISNQFIREAWSKQWKMINNQFLQKSSLLINKSTELGLILILINNIELLPGIIDKLLNITFKNIIYNNIIQYIMDNITTETPENIKNYIIKTYNLNLNKKCEKFLNDKTLYVYIQDYYNRLGV